MDDSTRPPQPKPISASVLERIGSLTTELEIVCASANVLDAVNKKLRETFPEQRGTTAYEKYTVLNKYHEVYGNAFQQIKTVTGLFRTKYYWEPTQKKAYADALNILKVWKTDISHENIGGMTFADCLKEEISNLHAFLDEPENSKKLTAAEREQIDTQLRQFSEQLEALVKPFGICERAGLLHGELVEETTVASPGGGL